MNKYYFTFGVGHKLEKYVQIIIAANMEQASQKMFEAYGREWAFSYTEEEFSREERNGHYWYMRKLPIIDCNESEMTFGEMRQWTERFNQILGAAQVNKERRLEQLRDDFKSVYGHKKPCVVTLRFYSSILELI